MTDQVTLAEVRKPRGKTPKLPKGCETWVEEHGYCICRVHYSADPTKTAEWAAMQKKKSPSENTFRREFEIDHYAGSGAAMYPEFSRSLHVCKPFRIPPEWTRYMGIDPHKRRPHAFLWLAVSPDGDHWCVSPETKILTADLRHVPAEEVNVGDEVAAFQKTAKPFSRREWESALVQEKAFIREPRVKITLEDGTEHVCSEGHEWLVASASGRNGHNCVWRQAKNIRVGQRLKRLTDVWTTDNSRGGGYLAAAYDGEASCSYNVRTGLHLSFAQRENEMLEKVENELLARGFKAAREPHAGSPNVFQLRIYGKPEIIRFLGTIRPARLLAGFSIPQLNRIYAFVTPRITKIERVGEGWVVALQTSAGTLVANGLASSNCYREYWPSRIYGKKGDTPEDDRLYKVDEYVKALQFMESAAVKHFSPNGFADNGGLDEKIRRRVMDTHGKAIFTTTTAGKDEPETFWDRYEKLGIRCKEAIKDVGSGRDTVGMRMRPRKVMLANEEREEAVIHIFETLPELIHELRTVRWPSLTPTQAEKMDPTEKVLQKRCHLTDLIRYIEMEDPTYLAPQQNRSVKPLEDGIAY